MMNNLSLKESITPSMIKDAVKFVKTLPKANLPVRHHFSSGIYVREIFMPAGSRVIGKKHKTRHLNIVISGKITIWTAQGRMDLTGPCVFESMAGTQKVVYMHTDCIFMTVHVNKDNERSDGRIEEMVITPEEQLDLFPELNSMNIVANVNDKNLLEKLL